jgi:ABC-type spermidine/putrescine transport system permease subunit I
MEGRKRMRKTTYLLFLQFLFCSSPAVASATRRLDPADVHPAEVWAGQYVAFFKDSFNRTIFFRSLRISLITTGICVVVGCPPATGFPCRRSMREDSSPR